MMLETTGKYNRKRVAKELGINPKAVTFVAEVEDAKAVSMYCTKHNKRPFSHHDLLY